MENWVEIHVPTTPSVVEGITNFLFEQNAAGCVEEKDKIIAYFKDTDFSEQLMARLQVYLGELIKIGLETPDQPIQVQYFQDQDWNLLWRQQFKPLRVTPRFVVKPPWIDFPSDQVEFVIDIDPKMAFGTGSHATTRFMILLMERHLQANQSVLDVGTGTAILAIAAWYLGARPIHGADNDPVAIECARESLELNHCTTAIELQTGTIDLYLKNDFQYDVILANIQKHIILEMLDGINQLLTPSGLFFVSGILVEQHQEVIHALNRLNFQIIDSHQDDEWIAMVFRKI